MIQVELASLTVDSRGAPVVILRPIEDDRDHARLLPIFIGVQEATAIMLAAEGTTATVACDGLEGACTRADLCSTVKFWTGLEKAIDDYVDGVTLADLARVPEIHLDIGHK